MKGAPCGAYPAGTAKGAARESKPGSSTTFLTGTAAIGGPY